MGNSQIIDYFSDTNRQLFYKISKNYTVPNFVKEAHEETYADISGLDNQYFADSARHKLPCHTKSATWLSSAYFLENYDNYEARERAVVLDKLIKKSHAFDIGDAVADMFKKKAANIARNDDPKYALITVDSGKVYKMFPTNTAENITKSASTLLNNRNKYTFEMRKTASRNILNAATSLRVALPANLEAGLTKSAGYGVSLGTTLKKALNDRVAMVKNSSKITSCQKLANLSLSLSSADITLPVLNKIASAIEEYDVLHDLTRYYGQIPAPEEICFSNSMEKLSSFKEGQIELKDGTLVKTADVMNIDVNDLKNVMGEKIASAFAPGGVYDAQEIEMILPSLPLDDTNILKTLLPDA